MVSRKHQVAGISVGQAPSAKTYACGSHLTYIYTRINNGAIKP